MKLYLSCILLIAAGLDAGTPAVDPAPARRVELVSDWLRDSEEDQVAYVRSYLTLLWTADFPAGGYRPSRDLDALSERMAVQLRVLGELDEENEHSVDGLIAVLWEAP